MTERLASIDALRGTAVLMVVAEHALTYPDVRPPAVHTVVELFMPGRLGVILFFVLSGFCIHRAWVQRGTISWAAFWQRRVRRLYPPYVVALVGSMALVAGAALMGIKTPLAARYPEPLAVWMAADFVAHLTMLHGLYPVFDSAGGNPPFWTLAREEYLYALYAIALWARVRWGLRATLGGIAGLGVAVWPLSMLASPEWAVLIQDSALVLWIQWALGMAVVEAAARGLGRGSWWLVLGVAVVARVAQEWAPILAAPLWGVAAASLVALVVARGVTTRWLPAIGLMSYSVYLVHYPVRGIVKYGINAPYPVMVIAMTVASLLAGWAFFVVVERRFLTASARIARTVAIPTTT